MDPKDPKSKDGENSSDILPEQPSIDEEEYFRLKRLHDSSMGTDEDEDNWQYWRSIVLPYS